MHVGNNNVLRVIYDVVFVLDNYIVFLVLFEKKNFIRYYFEKKIFIKYFLKMDKKNNGKLNSSRYLVLFWKENFY